MSAGMQRSDEELYREMRRGDTGAFAELYERREPGLYRFALHMTGSPALAEEIAHEVFVQLMGPVARFDDAKGTVEGWMFGVARNLIRSARRKGPVEEPVDQPYVHDIVGGLIEDERHFALRQAIAELPEAYREAVVLCDLEERNYDDAARVMNCPVGTVRSRLHRARALLGAKLKRRAAAEVV
jgi:RNA polymerase sigma-70 factor (ECF subfamily)